jgi:hypothetical protein
MLSCLCKIIGTKETGIPQTTEDAIKADSGISVGDRLAEQNIARSLLGEAILATAESGEGAVVGRSSS